MTRVVVVVAVLLRMDEQIRRLEERVARQDERIAELERKLNRSSWNSSAPPSSDSPAAPSRSKDRSGRKRGAQDGHGGHGRPLLPAWVVDEVIEHWPERCHCGHVFSKGERVAVGEPARHQIEELPLIDVRVSEHRAQRVCCPECGRRTRAALPGEVARSNTAPCSPTSPTPSPPTPAAIQRTYSLKRDPLNAYFFITLCSAFCVLRLIALISYMFSGRCPLSGFEL